MTSFLMTIYKYASVRSAPRNRQKIQLSVSLGTSFKLSYFVIKDNDSYRRLELCILFSLSQLYSLYLRAHAELFLQSWA